MVNAAGLTATKAELQLGSLIFLTVYTIETNTFLIPAKGDQRNKIRRNENQ